MATGHLEENAHAAADNECLIPSARQAIQQHRQIQCRNIAKASSLLVCAVAVWVLICSHARSVPSFREVEPSDVVQEFLRKTPGKGQTGAKTGGGTGVKKKGGGGFAAMLRNRLKRGAEAKLLADAASVYSEEAAAASAIFSKMAYCGQLPGIYASMATSCSRDSFPGTTSTCQHVNMTVIPGLVRTFSAKESSVYGIVARIENTTQKSPFSSGVMISVRGSVNNFRNSVKDKQTRLEQGPDNCENCHVHQGYYASYSAIKEKVRLDLLGLNCLPGSCTVYVTGHAAGGAIASMFAWELSHANYTIGVSYIFEPPQLGDAAFARNMGSRFSKPGGQGPIFSLTHGKDSIPRWPFEPEFKTWGLEAYYADEGDAKYSQLCYAGRKKCGIHKIPKSELTTKDACYHPVAPDRNFCDFKGYIAQCWGGLSHQYVSSVPLLWQNSTQQPDEQAAADWSPAEADGKQKAAMDATKKASQGKSQWRADYYNLKTLKAFAALAKAAYCGGAPGFKSTILKTCNGKSGVCADAGFGVVPTTVRGKGVSYQSDLTNPYYMEKTLFFYTGLIRRTTAEFADKPYFMPSEACVLVIRGSTNLQNSAMNKNIKQMPLDDEACKECTVNTGINEAWKTALEPRVFEALSESGCEPHPKREKSANVFISGHSMGGTMGTLAAYYLHKAGFQVQLSWLLEAGRAGNPAFIDYLSTALTATRPVPLWLTTNTNDKVPRTPKSVFAGGKDGRLHFEVHFNSSKSTEHTFCLGKDGSGPKTHCGMYQFDRSSLDGNLPNAAHCDLAFAPSGQMCMLQQTTQLKYQLASQCFWGGSL